MRRNIDALAPAANEWTSYREPALKLLDTLSRYQLSLSVVDGCGGHLVNQLTVPGATRAFRMGVVVSSWSAKIDLGIPDAFLRKYGEFSLETAKKLATLALDFHNDKIGLAAVGEFVAIAQKGKDVWGTRTVLPSEEKVARHLHQFAFSQSALSLAYMYLQGHHQQENNLYRLPAVTKTELADANLTQKIQQLTHLIHNSGFSVSTMESCSGGAVACAFESADANILNSAWVTYDEDAKIQLGVPIHSMSYGTVYSKRVALAMAQAIQQRTGAEIAIATTGTLDTADTRPFHTDTFPGTVYTAICIEGKPPIVEKHEIPLNSREKMKTAVVHKIVDDLLILLSVQNTSREAPQTRNTSLRTLRIDCLE